MIDTDALRSKIIDLAIMGKLTKRLPEDGIAEKLRVDAKKYKEELAKEGILKNRKNKNIKEINDEECLFELPSSWCWFRLGEVIEVFGRIGFRGYKKSDLVQKGQGAITMSPSNISKNGEVSFDSSTYISWDKYEESPEIMLEEGDVVLVKTGSTYGKCGIINELPEKATINPQLAILKYINCNRKYLYYVLQSSAAWTQYEGFVVGAATPTFSQENISNMMIPMPPMAEQERIVAKIDEVLAEIKIIDELQSQYASNVEVLKSKIIDAGIRGQLTEQLPEDGTAEELYKAIQTEKSQLIKEKKIKKEKPLPEITADEIPFEIPENWKWVRWGDISQSIQYGYNAPALENGRIKMVRISDIQSNEVLWEDVPYCDIDEDSIETYLLQPNDILFARTGGTVGKSYLVEEVPEEAVYAGYLIRTRYSRLLSPRYLKYFMQGSLYWSQLRNGTIATAQPNCNGKTLGKMIVPLPPLSEQKRIVAKIDEVFSALDKRD